jgi:hypothetical protein
MRSLAGAFVIVICTLFGCCQAIFAAPASPVAAARGMAPLSAMQDVAYTYRRTKHGFERCFHRNRFTTRSWRSVFRRIPDC